MGAAVPFIDIIIFAVIAVLLVLRLRSVLGQRNGYEQPQNEQSTNQFDNTRNDKEDLSQAKTVDDKTIAMRGLDALRQVDRSFNEKDFISGATTAFEMILIAYAEGDLTQLKRLFGYDLLQSFTQSIEGRISSKESLSITLDELREASILNIS